MEPTHARKGRTPASLILIVAGATAAVVLVALGRQAGAALPRLAAWIEGLGIWGAVVFVLVYAAAVVLFVPGSLLTLAGGAMFGLARGFVIVFIAAVLGSTLAFLTSRYVARGAFERRLASDRRFVAVDRAIAAEGARIVLLLRLSPVVPFTILNYVLGLTRVRLRDVLLGSIGMAPGTLLYVYYGKLAGDVATLAAGSAPPRGMEYFAVLALGLAATIAATVLIARAARRALGSYEL